MYRILLRGIDNPHEYEELIKIFLIPGDYEIVHEGDDFDLEFFANKDKNILKKEIFLKLEEVIGKTPPWGIITGIRPVKLFGEIVNREGSIEKACEVFSNYYKVSDDKVKTTKNIYEYQKSVFGEPSIKSVGIYIGIPFCPTRCLYCSFTSNQVECDEIDRYLVALYKEIKFVGDEMKKNDLYAETIYIGGGTPTSLNEKQLADLFSVIDENLYGEFVKEYTVEAGRPDTITRKKLETIKEFDIDRISINPQSMNDETLKTVGRNHSSEDIRNAFKMANEVGIKHINADLIAGLPKEDINDFKYSVEEVKKLKPTSITVHSLAIKRASRLVDIDKDFHYKQADTVREMLDFVQSDLINSGYNPYYLYRQKHMAGALENIGYCKKNSEGLYNARIMEEHQSIIAIGAGGMSKRYYYNENRHERIANVSNYKIYIDKIEEMLDRKRKDFFKEVTKC